MGSNNKDSKEHADFISKIAKNDDYYVILGLDQSCSIDDVKKAYKKLALKVHPDKNSTPGSTEAFKKLGEAFTCLSDENWRRMYDQTHIRTREGYESNYQQQDASPKAQPWHRHDHHCSNYDDDDYYDEYYYYYCEYGCYAYEEDDYMV